MVPTSAAKNSSGVRPLRASSPSSEALSVALSEEDLVCRRIDDLETVALGEVGFVFRIEKFVWQRLAFVAGVLLWWWGAQECMPTCCSYECLLLGAPDLLCRPRPAMVADLGRCGSESERAARGRRAGCHRPGVQEDSPTLGIRTIIKHRIISVPYHGADIDSVLTLMGGTSHALLTAATTFHNKERGG